MFFDYQINPGYNNYLCKIFHKALFDFEADTSVTRLEFGDFLIKPMVNTNGRYGVWYDKKFVMCIKDEPFHNFAAMVKENSFITQNMTEIIINCLIASFMEHEVNLPDNKATKKEAIESVHKMMAANSKHFDQKEMENMSELLYGKENKKQMNRQFRR